MVEGEPIHSGVRNAHVAGWKYTKGTMLTLMKLAAGVVIAIGVLSPGMTPRADKCECKTSGRVADFVPKVDTCECKAKAN